MANTDNECSSLKVDNVQYPDFDKVFEMQETLQRSLGYKFENMSLQDVVKFWFMNKHALEDEISEMFDALGGIKDGIGNAVWKPWKKQNRLTPFMTIQNLTEEDKKELLMEMVDILHFYVNFAISVGFTGSDIANAYVSKNQENHDRQKKGY